MVAVVDDDQGVLRSLECLLASADFTARLYASGEELLDSGRLAEIDCLICDIDMPGMDGFELEGRVHAVHPGLPIIFITAYPDRLRPFPRLEKQPRCFTKPFQGPALLAAVSESIASIA